MILFFKVINASYCLFICFLDAMQLSIFYLPKNEQNIYDPRLRADISKDFVLFGKIWRLENSIFLTFKRMNILNKQVYFPRTFLSLTPQSPPGNCAESSSLPESSMPSNKLVFVYLDYDVRSSLFIVATRVGEDLGLGVLGSWTHDLTNWTTVLKLSCLIS